MSLQGRTGLLGGTFNPIHVGHLRVAEEALRQYELREVVFVPTGRPPHRAVAEGTPAEDRYTMVCLATAYHAQFSVSRIEVERAGPCYTIDTVVAMNERCANGVACIVGADIFTRINTWHDWPRLLRSCPFVVAPRPGTEDVSFRHPPFDQAEVHLLQMKPISVSSSEVRRRYRAGLATDGMVPPAVDQWIRDHHLYGVAPSSMGG